MPWTTPTLATVRTNVRDAIRGQLPGADAAAPNSVLRVMSDVQAALCSLTLQYIDWLSLQLLPDTAEDVWLDRFAAIWLVNADGTTGRKMPTLASGSALFTGTAGFVVPAGTQMTAASTGAAYETLEQITLGPVPTAANVQALTAGSIGNLDGGSILALPNPPPGVANIATVELLTGGNDTETDDELRARVLARIREPPMGGDQTDYVQWALAVPGVTRAWCYPQEMGIGTCTVRFMMDELRADNGGFPLPDDVDAVAAYLNGVRPVTVKDLFVESPIPYPINLNIAVLDVDQEATHAAIIESLQNEFFIRSVPGQTWYRAWTDAGIMAAAGVNFYDLVASDVAMPGNGYMPVLGDVTYG